MLRHQSLCCCTALQHQRGRRYTAPADELTARGGDWAPTAHTAEQEALGSRCRRTIGDWWSRKRNAKYFN